MKRLTWAAAVVLLASSAAMGQEPGRAELPRVAAPNAEQHPSMANLTPEMWLYMQELQRHDDPEMAVRRKAELRAAQRNHRMAARKWFGLSNARPSASPVPVMGTYSPYWAGNDSDPYRWNGVGPAVIVVEETVVR
jgi:hypothetical protein